jgi:hypothetical protein
MVTSSFAGAAALEGPAAPIQREDRLIRLALSANEPMFPVGKRFDQAIGQGLLSVIHVDFGVTAQGLLPADSGGVADIPDPSLRAQFRTLVQRFRCSNHINRRRAGSL